MADKKKKPEQVPVKTLVIQTQEGVTFEMLAGMCFLMPTSALIQRHNELIEQRYDCTYVHALCVEALLKVIRQELKNRGYIKDATNPIYSQL